MYQRVRLANSIARRAYSQATSKPPTPFTPPRAAATAPSSGAGGVNTNVPGLSTQCVKPATEPVGPGAAPTAPYKVPEYFSFNRFSFAEAEVEMAKFRCPQPSAVNK